MVAAAMRGNLTIVFRQMPNAILSTVESAR